MDIEDLVKIKIQKNGKTKISYDFHHLANIYRFLNELGYCSTKLDGKQIYFRRAGDEIIPTPFFHINDAFFELLRKGEFDNMPSDLDYSLVMECFYWKPPIKESGALKYYLSDRLTPTEEHTYRLLTDLGYKLKFEAGQLLSKFDEWALKKVTDKIGAFAKPDNLLFYKNIGDNKFLLFNQYNAGFPTHVGFDCQIATFKKEDEIGIKKPIKNERICLNFHLERDYFLLKNYIN